MLYEIILNLLAQHQVSDNPIMELSGCWNLSGRWLVSGRAHSAGWGHGFYLFLALLDGKTPMFIDPGETTGWWKISKQQQCCLLHACFSLCPRPISFELCTGLEPHISDLLFPIEIWILLLLVTQLVHPENEKANELNFFLRVLSQCSAYSHVQASEKLRQLSLM